MDVRSKMLLRFRITIDHLVASLLNHRMTVQLIGALLIGEEIGRVDAVDYFDSGMKKTSSYTVDAAIPNVPQRARSILLLALKASVKVTEQFDSRPALRLLLQKLIGVGGPANLYRTTAAAGIIMVRCYCHLIKDATELEGYVVARKSHSARLP